VANRDIFCRFKVHLAVDTKEHGVFKGDYEAQEDTGKRRGSEGSVVVSGRWNVESS